MVDSRRSAGRIGRVTGFTESEVEGAVLAWLESIGWNIVHGSDIAPDTLGAERDDYGKVALERRVCDALAPLNPDLPETALDDACRNLTRPQEAMFEARNRAVPQRPATWLSIR